MKLISTPFYGKMLAFIIVIVALQSITIKTFAQGGAVCTSPNSIIYGLTSNGAIYPINVSTGTTGSVIKNTAYSGNSVSSANGMGYNSVNGKFYYFKRNVGSSPQEFVSFDPTLNIVSILASSGGSSQTHTGCVSANGLGYYMIDMNGSLYYYNIAGNSWTFITSSFTDQYGNNVTSVIKSQNAGDIAIDGNGNLWIITSSSSNYGVYKLSAPLPTTAVAALTVTRIVNPATTTPSGNMIAGIAFNPTGQIFLSTKNDDRLYRLENNLTTTYLGTFSTSDVGNDLTSCNFPNGVLPVMWVSFDVVVKNKNNAELKWVVTEINNKGFYIQHSKDGNNWEDLVFIQSRNAGESTQDYAYTHYAIGTGKHYYRIRQVDIDGKESFSTIKEAEVKKSDLPVSIWPNPVKENINILNDGNNGSVFTVVTVFDQNGKMIFSKTLQAGSNSINLASLNPGMYILQLSGSIENKYTQKIIKQ